MPTFLYEIQGISRSIDDAVDEMEELTI